MKFWNFDTETTRIQWFTRISPWNKLSLTRLSHGGIDWHDPRLSLALVFGQTLGDTVDGWNPARVEEKIVYPCLSHYLQGFIHTRWLFGISEPSAVRRWGSCFQSMPWMLKGTAKKIACFLIYCDFFGSYRHFLCQKPRNKKKARLFIGSRFVISFHHLDGNVSLALLLQTVDRHDPARTTWYGEEARMKIVDCTFWSHGFCAWTICHQQSCFSGTQFCEGWVSYTPKKVRPCRREKLGSPYLKRRHMEALEIIKAI